MWRDRILETKKAKGLTTKMISEVSQPHIPTDTITHILTAKTDDPRISTVLALAEAVGLSPWELFAEPTTLVAYQGFLTLQKEVESLKAEKEALVAENVKLKDKVDALKDETSALKDELIDVLKSRLKAGN